MASVRQFGHWLRHAAGFPLLAVLLIACANFSLAFTWGAPQAISPDTMSTWQIDTIAPVAPLTEAYYRFTREGTEPVVYPLFHFVVLDIAYAPYVAYQYLMGGLVDPGSEYPYGAVEPARFFRTLTLIARGVSLLMALGIVIAVFEITRRLFSRQAALWSALLTALIAPLAYYAKTSNLDVPYLFWTLLAVWQIVLIADGGKLRNYLAFAAFAAFAVASKDQAYGFFVVTPLLLIYLHARGRASIPGPSILMRSAVSKPILLTAVTGAFSFALANNLLFGGLEGFLRHIDFARTFYATHLEGGDVLFLNAQLQLLVNAIEISLQMMGPVTVLLVVAGVLLVLSERRYVPVCLLVLLSLSYYVFVLGTAGVVLPRYLLGPVILMMPFAGYAIAQAVTASASLGYSMAFLAFASQLLLSAHLSFTLVTDSRIAMARWIRANVPNGSSIETQVQQRYLPHIGDAYRVNVVGNAFDAVTYDSVPEDLTPARLAERDPDYVLVLENLGVTGDPARTIRPDVIDFYTRLLNGELGYQVIVRFETGNYLPFRQLTAGTLPTSILLARVP